MRRNWLLLLLVTTFIGGSAQEDGKSGTEDKQPGLADYERLEQRVQGWVKKYPKLVSRQSIGKSNEGRDLTILRISSSQDDSLPAMYVGAGIHGVETSERDLLWWIEHLLNRSDRPRIRKILGQRVIWAQPTMNPDGLVRRTRKNALAVDLNRNFGRHWQRHVNRESSGYPGKKPFSEPETRAVRDFLVTKENLRVYVDFHRVQRMIIVPDVGKGGSKSKELVRVAKKLNEAMGDFRTHTLPFRSPTQGGFSIDWVWYRLGVAAFTWELPRADEPAFRKDYRWKGLLYLLESIDDLPRRPRPVDEKTNDRGDKR